MRRKVEKEKESRKMRRKVEKEKESRKREGK